MTSRTENKTLYQNNGVELNDEALANVIGGCGGSDKSGDWNQVCNDWIKSNDSQCGSDYGSGRGSDYGSGRGSERGSRGHSLLGILDDLVD